ncbi:hypothetical protein ACFP1Z_00040 [Streptomyces gamaensis]|uniref:Uncharacterized protein n=1 Tax=Streptomyces gamaensis TaxID=1763542 RepID=A0ABW0YPT5_9ACTN
MSTPVWWDELMQVSEVLAAADRAEVTWWRGAPCVDSDGSSHVPDEDDVPPLTVRLGSLGTVFAERAGEITPVQCRQVLGLLERVQTHGSEYDGTAVATGFFEALLNEWDKGFDLRSIWDHVGPESRAYCVAWNDFNGVSSPDWMRQP